MTLWWVSEKSKAPFAQSWMPSSGAFLGHLARREIFSRNYWVAAGGRHYKRTNAFPEHVWRSLLASHHNSRNNNSTFPEALAAIVGAWLDPHGASKKVQKTNNSTFQRPWCVIFSGRLGLQATTWCDATAFRTIPGGLRAAELQSTNVFQITCGGPFRPATTLPVIITASFRNLWRPMPEPGLTPCWVKANS